MRRASSIAVVMTDRPGAVSTKSAAARAFLQGLDDRELVLGEDPREPVGAADAGQDVGARFLPKMVSATTMLRPGSSVPASAPLACLGRSAAIDQDQFPIAAPAPEFPACTALPE